MVFCLAKERAYHRNKKLEKPNRKDKCDLGDDFIAPDGGWGWLVCLATGCSNLVAFTVIQQFGLLFRERLSTLGFSNSQITTMINVNSALSAATGLLNGPMFRRFSYRQVALAGATLMTSGLLLTSFADSFLTYIITFSVLFAIGLGISISASSLALNTYFKEKRRMATGFSWTITALGPIFMPYLVTGLVNQYDVQWSVIILSAITMHSFACAMIYQPVLWHVKKLPVNIDVDKTIDDGYKCVFCRLGKRKNTGIFSSQYLHNTDDEESPGYEITDPGTPMMSRANDGWFSRSANKRGSRCSLTSGKSVILTRCTSLVRDPLSNIILKETDEEKDVEANTTPTMENQMEAQRNLNSNRSSINFEKETMKQVSNISSRKNSDFKKCTCHEERELLNSNILEENKKMQLEQEEDNVKLSIAQKLVLFFDLDLLKDPTYDNLMVGLTLANFAEMNFSILTPFILMDFGYSKEQTALAMSFLGGMDTGMRFIIPFCAEKIGFENRTFFLFGIFGMAIGRFMLAHTQSYTGVLIVFAWIGINKGLRTIFMALVIPSYVPLKRLPAASGLQLITMGLFSIIAGPIVGLIRDATDYRFTLHCINIITFATIASWGLEIMYRKFCKKET